MKTQTMGQLIKATRRGEKLMILVTDVEGRSIAYGIDPTDVDGFIQPFKQHVIGHQVDPVACAKGVLRMLMEGTIPDELVPGIVGPALMLAHADSWVADGRATAIRVHVGANFIEVETYHGLGGMKISRTVH